MKPAVSSLPSGPASTESSFEAGELILSLVVSRAPAHLRRHPWVSSTGLPLKHLTSAACHAATSPVRTTLPRSRARARRTDKSRAVRLDQYYTRPRFAERCYRLLCQYYDTGGFLMVEPSAGKGVFARMLPVGSLAYDVEPKHPLVERKDFFEVVIRSDRPVIVIGNPPFGRNCRTAVRFFNHAARFASVIGMVLPRTVRKASVENKLDRAFHLVREELAPANAFEFEGRSHDVPAIFQIWERRAFPRSLRSVETRHPDFDFVGKEDADFFLRRIGVRAGRIHRDRDASKSSHYFIKGDVEEIMRELDFAGVAADTAGVPSLAKNEIVALYRQHVEGRRSRRTKLPPSEWSIDYDSLDKEGTTHASEEVHA